MLQIPDSLREQLAPLAKYHFWLLVPLVPLVLLPAVFLADAGLEATISQEKSKIDGQAAAMEAIRGEQNHPNEAWAKSIDAQAAAIRSDLVREWQALWDSQQDLRTWPPALGNEFLGAIAAVEAGTRPDLEFRDRELYMNTVLDLVRKLPQVMGCEQLMDGDGAEEGGAQGGRFPPGQNTDTEAFLQLSPLEWRAADQRRIFASFRWEKPPSTWQVRLAQEELWVYGLLCDTIGRMNKGAKGAFDATVTTVDELAVGYPAAEDQPGGADTGRIVRLVDPAAAAQPDDGLPRAETTESPARQPRPYHPRFSDVAARPTSSVVGGEAQPALSAEDELRQWIYVDFNGQPLTAPELATVPDARMVHLMPFLLRVTIDQRQVDRLLADLAANPIPIDVRQVRINVTDGGPGQSRTADQRRRAFDVTLELRGTVGLATPPDPAVLGVGDQPAGGGPAA